MSRRTVEVLLEDMWEAIEKIERYTKGVDQETFQVDDKTVDSVVRNLQVIGEAANRLPGEFKASHSDIEWTRIVGLRHRIVHDYFAIDLGIVWEVVTRDLPDFKDKLRHLREAPGPRE